MVRPSDLGMPSDHVDRMEVREHREEQRTTVRGAVPTAITQALALQAASAGGAPSRVARPASRPANPASSGLDRDVRELERSSTLFMSHDSANDELDRLDAKGYNMTEKETARYRELLSLVADQSRHQVRSSVDAPPPPVSSSFASSTSTPQAAAITTARRTETLIDDVEPGSSGSNSARENISPPGARRSAEKKSVQFMDEQLMRSPGEEELDSPSIVGTNEVYRDPRQRRLNELQDRQMNAGPDGSNLEFRDKMKLFAHQIGEGTPKQRFSASSAERHIQRE